MTAPQPSRVDAPEAVGLTNDEIYARAGALTAYGYPLTDADPRHDPHCGWHWFNRCNCSQALKGRLIIQHVTGAAQ